MIPLSIIVIVLLIHRKRNKNIKLLKNFSFKYKMRVIGKQGSAETAHFEAVVKAVSFDEAEKQLIKKLLSEYKIEVLITSPMKERHS
jgi:hypothetical protein